MSKKSKIQASEIRQKILSISKTINRYIESIISSNLVTKGTICEKKRRCGNAGCKCTRGDLHVTKILSFSHKGKSRIIHLSRYSDLELRHLEKRVRRYQQFRRSRAQIVYYFKLLITEINRMEQNILMEAASPGKGGDNGSEEKKDRY